MKSALTVRTSLAAAPEPFLAHAAAHAAGRTGAAVLFMRGNSTKLTAVNRARIYFTVTLFSVILSTYLY